MKHARSIKTLILLSTSAAALVASLFWHTPIGWFMFEHTSYRAAAAAIGRDAELFLAAGNHYFNVDDSGAYDIDKAEQYFLRALELDPQVPDAWHQLARISFLRGNFTEATERIEKQLTVHGDSLMAAYYIRGLIAGFAGDYEQAEIDFKRFLMWDPNNWAAHNDLAWVYFTQGKFKEMEEMSRKGLKKNTGNAWLLTMHGVALMNLDRKEEAKAVLEEAREAAELLTPFSWGRAYPGNDPRVSRHGLDQMKEAIEHNLALVNN